MKAIFVVMNSAFAVVKIGPDKKKFRPVGDLNSAIPVMCSTN